MTSAEKLKSLVERIERNRAEKKALTDHERDLFTEADRGGFDKKALRRVLQRRAMGDGACAELDGIVDTYELALSSKTLAAELIRGGATVAQAAAKAGVGVGTAHRSKKLISGISHDAETGEITESEAPSKVATAPIAGEREATEPDAASDPIPEPPAGSVGPSAGSPLPAAAPPPKGAVPAGDATSAQTPAGEAIRDGTQEVAQSQDGHGDEIPAFLRWGTPENKAARGGVH